MLRQISSSLTAAKEDRCAKTRSGRIGKRSCVFRVTDTRHSDMWPPSRGTSAPFRADHGAGCSLLGISEVVLSGFEALAMPILKQKDLITIATANAGTMRYPIIYPPPGYNSYNHCSASAHTCFKTGLLGKLGGRRALGGGGTQASNAATKINITAKV